MAMQRHEAPSWSNKHKEFTETATVRMRLLSLDATCFQMCPHGEMQKWKSRYRCVLGAPLRSLSVTIITVMSIIYEHNIFHN